MQEKQGIESTKVLIKFAIDLYLHFTERKASKGIFKKMIAALSTFSIVSRIDQLFQEVKGLKKELSDIDELELSELRVLVGKELNVKGTKTDRLVKVLLSFAVTVVKFINDVSRITKEEIEIINEQQEKGDTLIDVLDINENEPDLLSEEKQQELDDLDELFQE